MVYRMKQQNVQSNGQHDMGLSNKSADNLLVNY